MHQLVKDHPGTVLLGAQFNQDAKCFAIAYDSGFRVYNSNPMEPWVSREFEDGGLAIAAMLHRTNYIALVGGGPRPKFSQNKVVVWDDLKQKAALVLEFVLPVLNVLLSRTRIVVVLVNKVHIYSFASPPVKLASYDTAENPSGVAAMHEDTLAFPGLVAGRVQIVDTALDPPKVVSLIRAHRAPIQALALMNGHLASASTTGTIIRLHLTTSTELVHEYRRGLDKAIVYSLAFSPHGHLAVLSSKATLHIFEASPPQSALPVQDSAHTEETTTHETPTGIGAPPATHADEHGQKSQSHNRRHVLKGLPVARKYFGSEWSFVSAQTHESGPGVLGWVGDDAVIILWKDAGRWEKYALLRDSRELVREAWRRFDFVKR